MKLNHGLHLAYCTNIHRGQSWAETRHALEHYTLAVRDRVAPNQPYAIGLRLSAQAAHELAEPDTLRQFQRWLDRHNCYVFTINGFPYGAFHGTRVKEQVYSPDWTTQERLAFTCQLFDILVQLLPENVEGSVSTVPGSFKPLIQTEAQAGTMRANLWSCVEHISQLSQCTGHALHLGLEPEPLCYLETSLETARFFDQMRHDHPQDPRLEAHLGINYDTCHLAVEYEHPQDALATLASARVPISKIHLSSALQLQATPAACQALAAFADDVYLHQVIERSPAGTLRAYPDLDIALQQASRRDRAEPAPEWRIHFHIPLHRQPDPPFASTSDHILGLLPLLQNHPNLCHHLEMETYTWEVLPPDLKNRSVVDQLVAEYQWTLGHLARHGLAES